MNQRDQVGHLRDLLRDPAVQGAAASARLYSSSYEGTDDPAPGALKRRRSRRSIGVDPLGVASLMVDDEGVVFWNLDRSARRGGARRRLRRGVPESPSGEIVELYHFDRLDPNQVNDLLITKDRELTPQQGLWGLELDRTGDAQVVRRRDLQGKAVTGRKKRLLFIHGTFSKTEAFFAGMEQAKDGKRSIRTLFHRYDEVLAFDHPTLSASPVMNAFDLARLLAKADGPLDIIAHSRGGLVTRWLLEGYGLNGSGPNRAMLVGCPLAGTSLASPPRLKGALDVMSNIGTALKAAGAVSVMFVPFMIVPLALVRIAASVVTVAAKTPVVDAGVSMIPGLNGQSRVSSHPELMRLRAVRLAKPPEYFVVKSNFETENPGWKFWKYFRKDKLLDTGADIIFDGDNDLVVDTASMSDVPGHVFSKEHVLDYRTNATVHHTNYFSQERTLEFMLDRLA